MTSHVNKYAEIAIAATQFVREKKCASPVEAWSQAAAAVFPQSPSSRAKGCPKSAYLGLCEDGYVRGIPRGSYTSGKKNKHYAVKAVRLLNRDSSLARSSQKLWDAVMSGEEKKPNQQMEVVIGLWNADLLNG